MEEEKELYITGCPDLISFDCTEKIINQMKKNICSIKIEEKGIQGTGFFCKIPFPDKNNMLQVLMTNNHIINEDILYKDGQKISIYIKEAKKKKDLNLNNRIKYTNKKDEYDITIIEIKEADEIYNFMELDDNILNDIINHENENDFYIDKTYYLIQYPKGELSASYGIISKICEDNNYKFIHRCSTRDGSSGSPILTLKNKIIAIHTGGAKSHNYGTFLNYPIKDFINQIFNKDKDDKNLIDEKINEIFLKVINNKFKLNIKNENIINYKPIKKYLGDDGFKELEELFFHYKIKFRAQFLEYDFHKKAIEQMEGGICKIHVKNMQASGFFCRIPFPDKKNMLKVLISTYYLINEEVINQKDQKLMVDIKEGKVLKLLNINNRMKYINEKYNTAIIEIKEEDNIDNYIDLDDKILNDIIYNKNEIEKYKNNEIYLIQYPENELLIAFGKIESNQDFVDSNRFVHNCITNFGSSGSPILNLNNKVIGMHVYANRKNNKQIGQFLNCPIKEFIEINFYNNKSKEQIIKDISLNNNFLSQDNQMKKWNIINKNIGPIIFKELDSLYLSYKNNFEFTKHFKVYFKYNMYVKILEQMEKYVYKISIRNKKTIGFFCKILLKESNALYIMITNNNKINEDILNMKDSKISIELQKENQIKEISLTNRIKYTSKEYNTTIIEFKEEDGLYNYIELDEKIIELINEKLSDDNDIFYYFINEPMYTINNQIDIFTVAFSYIEKIYNDKIYNFLFKSSEIFLTNGAPIFNSKNKLIGIINNSNYKYPDCKGTFLNFPIKEFIYKNINKLDLIKK